jgi:DNA-binding transcriptional ArsR family regulator
MRLVDRREEGKKVLYRLSDVVREAFPARPLFVDWIRAWPALSALLRALRPMQTSGQTTQEARWIRAATALAAGEPAFRSEGFDVAIGDLQGWALRGPDVLSAAVERVTARVDELSE